MKKVIYILLWVFLSLDYAFAWISISIGWGWWWSSGPNIKCDWLPGCSSSSSGDALSFLWHLVAELIKYVAVVAVIALIFAGFMYIFSAGEEEKAKKARKWIFWSLIAVFISISWYFLINLINEAYITI